MDETADEKTFRKATDTLAALASPLDEPGQRVELRQMLAPLDLAPESRLPERVRVARTQLGLSIEALSRLCKDYDHTGNGVSPPSISRYEAGDSLPGARELRILCDSLDVPPAWLLYGRLENAGAVKAESELLRALDAYVRSKQDDVNIGGTSVSATLEWDSQRERADRLTKARRPGSP